MIEVIAGDCLEALPRLPADSVDACVTDPPYGLSQEPDIAEVLRHWLAGDDYKHRGSGFMGKSWDSFVPGPSYWREVFRVLKPGAHLLCFAGTRTQDLMGIALRMAGFEIRDCIRYEQGREAWPAWFYGTGFPKSLDVSKRLDAQAKEHWLDIVKSVDSADSTAIMSAWKEHLNAARHAAPRSSRSAIVTGTSTRGSDFALVHVAPQAGLESLRADAIIAELRSSGVHLTPEARNVFALESAALCSLESSATVRLAGCEPGSLGVTHDTAGSSALLHAWDSLNGSTGLMEAAGEALKTWLGRDRSSRSEALSALCVALTDALKHTTLSRSETFRTSDTTFQTAFASATTVIITESTAASLISFTADTLKRKAIDKAAGAEREVVLERTLNNNRFATSGSGVEQDQYRKSAGNASITAPATPEAAQWAGWGTSLKPAYEPVLVARKPLSERTVAANVLKYGCGALNIDESRIGTEGGTAKGSRPTGDGNGIYGAGLHGDCDIVDIGKGRWPANLIHDGSQEVLDAFAAFGVTTTPNGRPNCRGGTYRQDRDVHGNRSGGTAAYNGGYLDTGTAARFFYSSKANKLDRAGSKHPTVKPASLIEYLCRLVTPPGGTVLDPFAGSGTLVPAARKLGVNAILIEREPEYIADIERRIASDTDPAPRENKPPAPPPAESPPTLFDAIAVG